VIVRRGFGLSVQEKKEVRQDRRQSSDRDSEKKTYRLTLSRSSTGSVGGPIEIIAFSLSPRQAFPALRSDRDPRHLSSSTLSCPVPRSSSSSLPLLSCSRLARRRGCGSRVDPVDCIGDVSVVVLEETGGDDDVLGRGGVEDFLQSIGRRERNGGEAREKESQHGLLLGQRPPIGI
jgi:hypothetical protein